MKIRTIAAVAVLAGAATLAAPAQAAQPRLPSCTVVYGDVDSGAVLPQGIRYNDAHRGEWTFNGRVVGFSRDEDTTIYTTRVCAQKRRPSYAQLP